MPHRAARVSAGASLHPTRPLLLSQAVSAAAHTVSDWVAAVAARELLHRQRFPGRRLLEREGEAHPGVGAPRRAHPVLHTLADVDLDLVRLSGLS